MTIGVIGQKVGMTRLFTEEGQSIPVTVIEVKVNKVTQVKTLEQDAYQALQVTTGHRPASRVTKPMSGHFAKAKVEAGVGLWELRLTSDNAEQWLNKKEILVGDLFEVGQKVDVVGTTQGKGYAGTVKRHNFRTQDNTHGNSISHRAPGSIGQCQTPGRVFKGKKMSGHMGNVQRTIQNLEVVRVDTERQLLLVKGAIPGAKGSMVKVQPAIKTKKIKASRSH